MGGGVWGNWSEDEGGDWGSVGGALRAVWVVKACVGGGVWAPIGVRIRGVTGQCRRSAEGGVGGGVGGGEGQCSQLWAARLRLAGRSAEGGGGGRSAEGGGRRGTHWKPLKPWKRLENPNQAQPGGDNGRDRTKGGQVGTMAEE